MMIASGMHASAENTMMLRTFVCFEMSNPELFIFLPINNLNLAIIQDICALKDTIYLF